MYVAILIVLLVGHSAAQDPGCDFVQNVQSGQTYYIYNQNYPNSYTPGSQCRWIATCPVGTNCRLDCNDVNLPETPSCSGDRLLISRTGDPQLTSSEYYCGRGSISAVSVGRTISIGLITSRYSTGGKFLCQLYAQKDTSTSSCSCGYTRADRIVGGEETKPNEFPMMAGIVYVDESAIKCGAVIISKSYVLTAAHCVKGKSLNQIGVIVGEHDTSSGNDSPATQLFRVQWYKAHPQFTTVNYDYDIAVVKVLGEIVFSSLVGPVCLPFKFRNNDFTGAVVTILGWGTLFPGGATSDVLRKVNVNVISQASCRNDISTVTPRQVCTYARGKDACQDDSGGPLLYTDPSNGLLYHVGIVSYGKFCASTTPGVNTRITALLDWILTTAPDDYCQK